MTHEKDSCLVRGKWAKQLAIISVWVGFISSGNVHYVGGVNVRLFVVLCLFPSQHHNGGKLHIFSLPHKALSRRDAWRWKESEGVDLHAAKEREGEREWERIKGSATLVQVSIYGVFIFHCGFLPPTSSEGSHRVKELYLYRRKYPSELTLKPQHSNTLSLFSLPIFTFPYRHLKHQLHYPTVFQ